MKKGFTLVELLVTITIIAIFSAIGLVVYSSVLKQGRDSKRQSDLRSIQSALEQYYADQFYYPATLTFGSALSASGKTYMNTVPTGSPQYSYEALPASCSTNCSSYCLYAQLDIPGPAKPATCTNSSYNFAVTPP